MPPSTVRGGYDAVAREYADTFAGELAHKPLDRDLLTRFADAVRGRGEALDLGCGPGHTTAFLHALGVPVRGLDLSPALLREAERLHPGVPFEPADMLALARPDGSVAGVVAFYAVVHFTPDELRQAFAEMHRVLQPGGRLLLAFHVGDETVRVENFLCRPVALDFRFFRPKEVADELARAGFHRAEVIEREPYPGVEHPSRRAYLFAEKPTAFAVRPATAADHPALLDVWLRSVRASHTFLTEADVQELYPLVRDAALPNLELWVLTAGGVPVGFLGRVGASVEALFVAPEVWRRGGGRLLLEKARELAGGPLRVDVNEQNPLARRFYAANGFVAVGRSPVDGGGRPFPLVHLEERPPT